MKDTEAHLFAAVEHLLRIQSDCSCSILSGCGLPEITVKQAACLRTIDQQGDLTFSRMAEITRTSKPTVTEMINRCVRMECAYREPSPDDGRVQYIRLTEKGRTIARAERTALRRTIERMMESLDEQECALLADILSKVR